MDTRTRLLTPRMQSLLERIQRGRRQPLHALSPTQARAACEAAAEVLDLPRAPLRRVLDFSLPALDGTPLRARLYSDSDAAVPLLLYLHGGGFVIGSLQTHGSMCRQLALRNGAAVVALDHRLAPEHPEPNDGQSRRPCRAAAADLYRTDDPGDAAVRGARWLRPRCRRAAAWRDAAAEGHDDRHHRPVLGCQRDLAGARRRVAADSVSAGPA